MTTAPRYNEPANSAAAAAPDGDGGGRAAACYWQTVGGVCVGGGGWGFGSRVAAGLRFAVVVVVEVKTPGGRAIIIERMPIS